MSCARSAIRRSHRPGSSCQRRPSTFWSCRAGANRKTPRPGGARSVEFRGGRLSISGVELDSEGAAALREAVEGAVYEWREQTAALRVPDQPEARLAAVLAMAAGLRDARRSSDMLPAA